VRVRGTQKTVKPVEVNVDTVYVRTNIERIEEEEFEGWEYDEESYSAKEYIEHLSKMDDVSVIANLTSCLMGEVDSLRVRVEVLEGGKQ